MGLLSGKAVVVTGSGKGLGRAYAIALANEGAGVVVNDIDVQSAEKTAADIRATGSTAAISTDSVSSWAGAERIVGTCVKTFGRIDALVNNAGISRRGMIWEVNERQFDELTSVHLKGTFACAHFAAQQMKEQRSGSIINISSRAQSGRGNHSLYSAAKAAVLGATFAWSLELAPYGVRVNAIFPYAQTTMRPGFVKETTMHPNLDSHYKPGEEADPPVPFPPAETVAPIVVYLACDEASWISGQILFLAGDTLALVSHPAPVRVAYKKDGWTTKDLQEYFRQSIGSSLFPVGFGNPRYDWYGGVKPT